MNKQDLEKLGLNYSEIPVYLGILEYGKITPARLASKINVNRTTVYSAAKELVEKGLIKEDLAGPSKYLVATSPKNLQDLVEREEKNLQQKKEIAEQLAEELKKITQHSEYQVPKIVFIEERNLDEHLYKQTPVWDESILQYDKLWWGFQDKTFVKHYEKWIDWYWEKGSNPQTALKLISNESAEKIKKKKFERREIRFWDQSDDFTATTWVLGDYVVMIITSQRPHYLVEIHDKVLAHNLREVFKGIWNAL